MSSFDRKFNFVWWFAILSQIVIYGAVVVAIYLVGTNADEVWKVFLEGIRQIGAAARGE